jgi:hypothetical protein
VKSTSCCQKEEVKIEQYVMLSGVEASIPRK